MSEVFSFRLNKENPREVRAMKIIQTWDSCGYSLRYIATEALIQYGEFGIHEDETQGVLKKLTELIRQLETDRISAPFTESGSTVLPVMFTDSVRKSVKPGVKYGNK